MIPVGFAYERPSSLDGALALLAEHGEDASVLAGGHSLLPVMKVRLGAPEFVIDIGRLAELDYIRVEEGELRIGAMTRHAALLASPVVGEHYAIFHDAERRIADPPVRNRGTIGGSLCQGDPAEDLAAVASALRADLVLRTSQGTRTVPAREFHMGPYETAIDDAEMLTEVRVPIRPGVSSAYEKVKRRAGDWAVASAGAYLVLRDGVVADVGIGLTAVGAPHFCAESAEVYLLGKAPTEEHLRATSQLAADACTPRADQRGPVEYKRHLAGELTLRVLRRSIERAEGSA